MKCCSEPKLFKINRKNLLSKTLFQFNWECIYDSHYNVNVEMKQDDNSNVPVELIDKPFDYTNLELSSFSFSKPTFDVKGDFICVLTPVLNQI